MMRSFWLSAWAEPTPKLRTSANEAIQMCFIDSPPGSCRILPNPCQFRRGPDESGFGFFRLTSGPAARHNDHHGHQSAGIFLRADYRRAAGTSDSNRARYPGEPRGLWESRRRAEDLPDRNRPLAGARMAAHRSEFRRPGRSHRGAVRVLLEGRDSVRAKQRRGGQLSIRLEQLAGGGHG